MLRLKFYTILWVSIFSYFGVFCRVSLSYVSQLPEDTLLAQIGTGFFLPNIVGTLAFGVVAGLADAIPTHIIPLQIGFCTGFCGSCTTFATWQLATGLLTLHGRFLDGLMQSLITFSTSFLSLIIGRHIGHGIQMRFLPIEVEQSPQLLRERRSTRRTISEGLGLVEPLAQHFRLNQLKEVATTDDIYRPGIVAFSIAGAVLLSLTATVLSGAILIENWLKTWLVAVVFGPLGAVCRHLISSYNDRFSNFPVMTFLCNITASAINILIAGLAVVYKGTMTETQVFYYNLVVKKGLSTGCMGSLSTVSTFVNECWKLGRAKLPRAYLYAILSFVVGQLVVVLIGLLFISFGYEFSTPMTNPALNDTVSAFANGSKSVLF